MTTSIQWQRVSQGQWKAVGTKVSNHVLRAPGMKNLGVMQLCEQQNFAEEIESKIRILAFEPAKLFRNPKHHLDVFSIFDTQSHAAIDVAIDIYLDDDRVEYRRWPRRRLKRKHVRDKIRSKDVVIHTLPEGLEVSAGIGQLIKDAMQAEATRFIEGERRTWTRTFWDPDIFNYLVGVMQRNNARETYRELRRMFRQQDNMT